MVQTPKRILILSWEILPLMEGGLGVLVRSLVDELRGQGAEVTVLVPHNADHIDDVISVEARVKKYAKTDNPIPGLDDFTLTEFVPKGKKKHTRWPLLYSKGNNKKESLYPNHAPILTRAYAYAVYDWLQENGQDFDVIYGMDWMAIPTHFLLLYNNITTQFYYHINSTEVDRSGGYIHNNDQTAKALYELEKKGFYLAEKIAVVSDISKQILIEDYNIKADKINPIYNDITFEPEKIGFEHLDKGKNVLFMGRVVGQKGLFFLLETAVRVLQIDPQVTFIIAGDGSPEGNLLPEIVEYVAKKKLEKNILFTGWVNMDAKKQLYKTSQLFVMPSPNEPFGLTALEAIRSGVPTIASETSGFISVVPSTPTFAYYDIEAFANSILHFIQNKEVRIDLLTRQQADLSKHNWPQEVAKLLGLIDKV
jgi:glycosyltransferase involved in cell wall biosynthesis